MVCKRDFPLTLAVSITICLVCFLFVSYRVSIVSKKFPPFLEKGLWFCGNGFFIDEVKGERLLTNKFLPTIKGKQSLKKLRSFPICFHFSFFCCVVLLDILWFVVFYVVLCVLIDDCMEPFCRAPDNGYKLVKCLKGVAFVGNVVHEKQLNTSYIKLLSFVQTFCKKQQQPQMTYIHFNIYYRRNGRRQRTLETICVFRSASSMVCCVCIAF